MEEQASPSAAPPAPAKKGKGLWIGIAVIVIVAAILVAAVYAGVFNPPAQPDLPQAVYLVAYPGDAIKIVPPWYTNRAQWPTSWLYSEGLKTQSFINDIKGQGVDVSSIEGSAPTSPISSSFNNSFALFKTEYLARFSKQPNLFDPHSYDAVFVIALAMEKSNSTSTNSTVFKQALRDVANPPGTAIRPGEWAKAISEIANGTDIDYQGASGAVNFDQYGEVGSDYEIWDINATGQIVQKLFIPEGTWLTAGVTPPSLAQASMGVAQPAALTPKIGTILPITGALAAYGGDMQNATDLAASDINTDGGIQGATLTLVHDDSATNPTTGANAAQAQITAGVQAVVGAAASSVSQAVFAKLAPAGIIEISPASTSPVFTTSDTTDLFWRTAPSDALQGKAAAYYAYQVAGLRKMSVLYINNAYGVGLSTVFAQSFTARGGQIYRSVSFEPDQASYTQVLQTLFTPGRATGSIYVATWRSENA